MLNRLVQMSALLVLLVGLLLLLAAAEPLRALRERDELLGLSNRSVMVLGGAVHLAVCVGVLSVRDAKMRAMVLLWLGLNHLIYRLGLAWMAVRELPVLRATGLKVGIRPETLDTVWKCFIAYLILGGGVMLYLERRRRKRVEAQEFMEQYRRKRARQND